MRIAHVANFFIPELGYQERYLAVQHARMGHEVWMVTSALRYPAGRSYHGLADLLGARERAPGMYADEVADVTVIRLKARAEIGLRVWLVGLEKSLRSISPDVVIVHGITNFNAARMVIMKITRRLPAGCRLVFDEHMLYSAARLGGLRRVFYMGVASVWTPLLRKCAVAFVAVSEETRKFMLQFYGLRPHEVAVIPLGVDVELFRFDASARAEVRRELGIGMDDVVFIQTGKLIRTKGAHLLLEAIVPVMQVCPEVRVMFVGSGDKAYIRSLHDQAEAAQIACRVVWVASVPHEVLWRYYSTADVGVWPLEESMAILEASACGRPVIVRNSVVGHERTRYGGGITYRTLPELTDVLLEFTRDAERRAEMGRSGRGFAERNLDWTVIARQFLEVGMGAARSRDSQPPASGSHFGV